MKRLIVGITIAAVLALLTGMGYAWNEYLRTPPTELQPLSSRLVPLESPAGQKLLAESRAAADYDELAANFVPQSRKAYCSVASALTTLNAAEGSHTPLDQHALFDHPSVEVHPLKVSFIGMSLRELGEVLSAHGASVDVVPASTTTVNAFRQTAQSNLSREGDFLVANYERQLIGQAKSGHISPIAAYHQPSDRLLILDVAAHRYPPVWAPLEDVWKAMRAPINTKTTATRGFVVVHGDSR